MARTRRLALGRADGNLEIWSIQSGIWTQEQIFYGGRSRSIEGLTWTLDEDGSAEDDSESSRSHAPTAQTTRYRLFSIGYSTRVTEWNLHTGTPRHHVDGEHGTIWCMALQPRHRQALRQAIGNQMIAVGCDDGAVVLLNVSPERLEFYRKLPISANSRVRVLSMVWLDQDSLVVGQANGRIRYINLHARNPQRTVQVVGASSLARSNVSIWSLARLSADTFVTADSLGEIKIWEAPSMNLLQRLQGHTADAFSIQANAAGTKLLSSGMDRRTILYEMSKTGRWSKTVHRRLHQHDVRATAIYEDGSSSWAITGGVDGVPIITPFDEFGRKHHRRLPATPQAQCLRICASRKLALTWADRQVSLWSFAGTEGGSDQPLTTRNRQRLVFSMNVAGDEQISSADISSDGQLLVIATASRTQLFKLANPVTREDSASPMVVRKLKLHQSVAQNGARIVRFSPNREWLLNISRDSRVIMSRIASASSKRIAGNCIRPSTIFTPGDGLRWRGHSKIEPDAYEYTIIRAEFSDDSQELVAGDIAGNVWTWTKVEERPSSRQISKSTARSKGRVAENESDTNSETDGESSASERMESQWKPPSSSSLIPNLGSTPLAFAFLKRLDIIDMNSQIPVASADDRSAFHRKSPASKASRHLIVITAKHDVLEFDLASGNLSPWSRRNSPRPLPAPFMILQDRVIGCFTDESAEKCRLWAYGPTWLFALDMAQDLAPDQFNSVAQTTEETIPAGRKRKRGQRTAKPKSGVPEVELLDQAVASKSIAKVPQVQVQNFWISHSYRPIVGAGILTPQLPDGRNGTAELLPASVSARPQMVLLEAPESKKALPPRYHGRQEWGR